MEKIILVFTLTLMTNIIFSQDFVDEKPLPEIILPIDQAGKVSFDSIIEVPNKSRDILYTRALEWFAVAYKDSKNVLEIKDKESGLLVGKGYIPTNIWMNSPNGVEYRITIKIKDGKIKYTLTDFVHKDLDVNKYPGEGGLLELEKPACGTIQMTKKQWREVKSIVYYDIKDLLKSLDKKINDDSNDNW